MDKNEHVDEYKSIISEYVKRHADEEMMHDLNQRLQDVRLKNHSVTTPGLGDGFSTTITQSDGQMYRYRVVDHELVDEAAIAQAVAEATAAALLSHRRVTPHAVEAKKSA